MVRRAANTKFGKDHGFSAIRTVAEFQRHVPLRTYEKLWNEYWKDAFPHVTNITWPTPARHFALSSGTTSGTTKYIPCTSEMMKSYSKAGLDVLVHHITRNPASRIFGGKSFVLGGSTDLNEYAPGVFGGDLSGILVKTLPWWVQARYFPSSELALLKNWEEKIERLARESLTQDIRMLSGVPSWLLILMEKFSKIAPQSEGKLARIFPKLEMVIHGGVNFEPYAAQFKEILAGSRAELREVYPASEGFIAIADRGYREGMRVLLDNGIFYEFVPLEELSSAQPTRHWIENIELGVNYVVVLSSCAGVWSYILGDTVRFVDVKIPRLLVSGRVSYSLSAFGEHLIAEEIESSVAEAAASINTPVNDFSVGAIFPQNTGELGRHLYIVEFNSRIPSENELEGFTVSLDKSLRRRNEDYDAHRANGFGLHGPKVQAIKPGTFAAWMKKRGKLGGQHKVPRIINDQALLSDLKDFLLAYMG